jgi:acyl carrier protein
MQTAETEREIREFIVKNFLFGRQDRLQEETALFGNILDSTGSIDLVMFLQERFGITVEDDEIAVPENFGTLKQVVAFVESKIQSKA